MKLKPVSKDSRRALYEFGIGGVWKVSKLIKVKSDCMIGGHFHKKKDELFLVLSGLVRYSMCTKSGIAGPDETINVPRGTYHSFECTAGTTMICLASELHDPNDDHI